LLKGIGKISMFMHKHLDKHTIEVKKYKNLLSLN
jgi:hypothetical protein